MASYEQLIGNTPMVRIRYRLDGREGGVYAKLESYNLSGSIKDRMAAHIISRGEEAGRLKPGQPIVEVTSGNTGIALAAIGALTGRPVHIFMPDWVSAERRGLLSMYGAEIHLSSAEEGGFDACMEKAALAEKELGAFRPHQFENRENAAAHYLTTGREILAALPDVTSFVAGIGSGGTITGVARRLKEHGQVYAGAVEPDAMPLLSGGSARCAHVIEGIGDSFIPPLVDRALIDGVHVVNDLDSVAMAARLARELGLGVGISSGANFLAAVMRCHAAGGRVATVFPDDNKKYLTTALANPPALNPGAWSARIELLGYEAV